MKVIKNKQTPNNECKQNRTKGIFMKTLEEIEEEESERGRKNRGL